MAYDGDVRISIDDGEGALFFVAGQPEMDAGLETSVLISMFTDSGWWGNEQGQEIGSTLSDLMSSPLTDTTRKAFEDAVRVCLAWMVSEGVAESVDVSASIIGVGRLALEITTTEPGISTATTRRYLINWSNEVAHLEAI